MLDALGRETRNRRSKRKKESLKLTTRNNHPQEVDEEIIDPEIQELRTTVRQAEIVVIEHAGCVVEDQSIDLAHADDYL